MPSLVSSPGLAQPGALRPGFPGSPGFPGAPGYPNPFQLPGNLLLPADCGFSAWTGNWTATTNCTVGLSGAQAIYPTTQSMAITATAAGTVVVTGPPLPANAFTGYVGSLWLRAGATGRAATLGLAWYNNTPTLISTATSASSGLLAGAWTPLPQRAGSPAATATVKPVITITGMAAGETVYANLIYTAPSLGQVLIAWPTPPLNTPPLFADMTPFTRADQSIAFTRGRPDETGTVQAGNATLTLDNQVIPGAFSAGNPSTPFTIQLSRRLQVNFADETGTWHTRFDGTITDLVPGWLGGPGLESTVQVTATGLIAWLARNPGPTLSVLRTLLEEEMLADGPLVLYPLSDKAGSLTAADESGNNATPLTLHKYGSGGTMAFGSPGIIGFNAAGFTSSVLNAAKFTPAPAVAGDWQLEAPLAARITAAAGFTFEIWYTAAPITAAGIAFDLSALGRNAQQLYVSASSGAGWFLGYSVFGVTTTLSAAFTPATEGQMVLTVSGTTATLYINTVSVATITVPAAFTADYLTVGGPLFGGGNSGTASVGGGWTGTLSCAALYPGVVLSAGRRSAHWTAGSVQNQGQNISTLVANTLAYAGIPAGFTSVPGGGVSFADAFDATGQNALAMIQLYQQTDGGVFYEAANGQLTWQDRAARYAAQVTPALTLAGGQYEADLTYPLTTQYLINDACFANNTIPAGIRAVNSASVTNNGTYANGTSAASQFTGNTAPSSLTSTTAGSPLTGPWYSYPFQPATVPSPDVLTDAVNWQVNTAGSPVPRSPSVTIDLASALGTGTQASRAAVFAADVGSVIQLTGLPPTAPGGTRVAYLMIEGVSETFTRDDTGITWTLTFNTSPASQSAAWIAGDANMGVLDSTAVVGRGTDGASQSGTEYAGQPYPVPTFGAAMNRTGNVGANDMRGLTANTTLQISPPCATVQQVSLAQSIPNITATLVQFDTVWYDTFNGWRMPANATTYTVQLPGLYLLTGSVVFATNGIGDRGASLLRNGSIIGTAAAQAGFGVGPGGVFVTAQVQCAQGDTLQLSCSQTSGGALGLVTTAGGPVFSILWIGT